MDEQESGLPSSGQCVRVGPAMLFGSVGPDWSKPMGDRRRVRLQPRLTTPPLPN